MSITTINTGAVSVAATAGLQGKTTGKSTGTDTQVPVGSTTDNSASTSNSTELGEAVSKMQDYAQSIKRNLDFKMDDSTGRVVVKVINSDSGELIRQIPSEEVLELASRLEDARSLLVQEKA